jgi:adenylate cyclase
MPTQDSDRKLTAILIADVKGYSRHMGEDESWAIRMLDTCKEIMIAYIQKHKGRLVQAVGDNLLVEFASAVDAVQCAVEIQKELKIRNAQLTEDRRMEFRIGVNLGDVIEEGDKISGDGVNITAKIESLSAAGGVCISGTAYDYVKKKLVYRYEYLGEQSVNNIEKPVRVYRVLIDPKGFVARLSIWKGTAVRQWERLNPAVKVIIALVALANGAWQIYPLLSGSPLHVPSKGKFVSASSDKASKSVPPAPVEVASTEKMAFPLPDGPSIAVLPFVNMSEDPKQEFLCDGMTEDIITALSKVPRLLVIARNSTFTYKGKPVKVKQVSEELGVRYVLEGSLQRSGDRLRITAQLIDAITGHHLWAERYDRDLKDLFALQDEITLKILTAVQVKLTGVGQVGSAEKYYKGKQGLDCYLKLTEANGIRLRWNIDDNNLARRMIEEAIAICPENPMGYVSLGWVYRMDYVLGNTKSPRETLKKAIELAQKALAMDDSIAGAHVLLCYLYLDKRDNDKAIAEGERAVALNPGDWSALMSYANSLKIVGRPEEAIPLFQKAIRLTPFGASVLYREFGTALRDTGRFEEAVSAFKKAIQLSPNDILAHLNLATTYSMMGREKEARAEAAEVLRINPKFSVDSFAKILTYKDQSQKDKLTNALRKAGLK